MKCEFDLRAILPTLLRTVVRAPPTSLPTTAKDFSLSWSRKLRQAKLCYLPENISSERFLNKQIHS